MKRTQSKAVKPARKGVVKVPIPRGWYELPAGSKRKRGDRHKCHVGAEPDTPGFGEVCVEWGIITDRNIEVSGPYIRRNPRAARANKGRKV